METQTPYGTAAVEVYQPGQIALSADEQLELRQYEQTIQQVQIQAYYEVGKALKQIRDKRLYRGDYDDFDEYCQQKWDFGKRRGNQLIIASEVAENILAQQKLCEKSDTAGTIVPKSIPANEAQARILAQFEPGEQLELLLQAEQEAPEGRITAGLLERLAKKGAYRKSYTRISSGNTQRRLPSAPRPADAPPKEAKAPETLCAFCQRSDLRIYRSMSPNIGICKHCAMNAVQTLALTEETAAARQDA